MLLLALPSSLSVAQLMRDLKANSSRHLNQQMSGFAWQDGYCRHQRKPVTGGRCARRYIEQQESHHSKRTFEDEYIAMLKKSGVQHSTDYVLG